jgi:hypothetical protein
MKSLIFSVLLVISLSSGAFAQGRGRGGGPPSTGPSVGRTTPATVDHGNAGNSSAGTTRNSNSNSNTASKQISDHPVLASKLQSMLPAGTNMDTAAAGFRNVGQFAAAVHVSHNLNIPFDQLKSKMVDGNMSLGDAIHTLKPDLPADTAKEEIKKAEAQAKDDSKNRS